MYIAARVHVHRGAAGVRSDGRELDCVGAVTGFCSNRPVTLSGSAKRVVSDLILNIPAIRRQNTFVGILTQGGARTTMVALQRTSFCSARIDA